MRADQFLVEHGYFESRARASAAIKAGLVKVNGKRVKKPSEKIPNGASILAKDEHPWVSRGGLKLTHALDVFSVDPTDRVCLDVGSSTGGFTDVLLSRGAEKVYAVDVGRAQLHPRLRGHEKVVSMEGCDARNLTPEDFDPLPGLIVCDASFISMTKVLQVPLELVEAGAELVSLVKPQFEVGPDGIGRGGLVKSEELAKRALSDVGTWVENMGWTILGTTLSPIKGGDGNTEFLLHAQKR